MKHAVVYDSQGAHSRAANDVSRQVTPHFSQAERLSCRAWAAEHCPELVAFFLGIERQPRDGEGLEPEFVVETVVIAY